VIKQQAILLAGGIILLVGLFFFAKTTGPSTEPADSGPGMQASPGSASAPLTTESIIDAAKQHLSDAQHSAVIQLEQSVVRGDVKDQKIRIYRQLSDYWRDSLNEPEIGAYYAGESAKLEKSEKNLTFAARLFLGKLMATEDAGMQNWLATNAKSLYEEALKLNPVNDSLKIELGTCYLFSTISATPMEGILKIKEVADRDSSNMYAQLMLGLGDIRSGQYDKAIERLTKVTAAEPQNLQAIFNLAETYERKADKANAIKWYTIAENMVTMPDAKKELQQRINSLK